MTQKMNDNSIYNNLLEDCQAIVGESNYKQRETTLEARYELGRSIFQANDEMGREKIYGQKIVEKLSIDLGEGYSPANLYDCIKFYKKYPPKKYIAFSNVLENLPEGKNTSWRDMRHKHLRNDPKEQISDKNPQKQGTQRLYNIDQIKRAYYKFYNNTAEQETPKESFDIRWGEFVEYFK